MNLLASYWPWPDLQLAWPLALLALPLPLLMRWWKRRADPGAALRVPYAATELQALSGGGRVDVSWLRTLLLWLGWCALCVALARPQQLGDGRVRQHGRGRHGAGRAGGGSPDRGQGRAG